MENAANATIRKPSGNGRLSGRIALITGSSRGIGAEIARRFAVEGASVAVHGRDAAAIDAVRDGIERAGGRAVGVRADVTNYAEIEAARDRIERELGPVDILVANAGANLTPPGQPLEQTDEAGWQASIDANLTATFLTIRSFLPGMKQRGSGNIITLSSAAARRPTARSPMPYAIAKAGIELLTKHLALQAGPAGIRVNCIAPETILTEENERLIPLDHRAPLVDMHPIRRLGTPGDVAAAALFLASEEASWISGIVLDIAGGAVLV